MLDIVPTAVPYDNQPLNPVHSVTLLTWSLYGTQDATIHEKACERGKHLYMRTQVCLGNIKCTLLYSYPSSPTDLTLLLGHMFMK
jgi:hypothetical protein